MNVSDDEKTKLIEKIQKSEENSYDYLTVEGKPIDTDRNLPTEIDIAWFHAATVVHEAQEQKLPNADAAWPKLLKVAEKLSIHKSYIAAAEAGDKQIPDPIDEDEQEDANSGDEQKSANSGGPKEDAFIEPPPSIKSIYDQASPAILHLKTNKIDDEHERLFEQYNRDIESMWRYTPEEVKREVPVNYWNIPYVGFNDYFQTIRDKKKGFESIPILINTEVDRRYYPASWKVDDPASDSNRVGSEDTGSNDRPQDPTSGVQNGETASSNNDRSREGNAGLDQGAGSQGIGNNNTTDSNAKEDESGGGNTYSKGYPPRIPYPWDTLQVGDGTVFLIAIRQMRGPKRTYEQVITETLEGGRWILEIGPASKFSKRAVNEYKGGKNPKIFSSEDLETWGPDDEKGFHVVKVARTRIKLKDPEKRAKAPVTPLVVRGRGTLHLMFPSTVEKVLKEADARMEIARCCREDGIPPPWESIPERFIVRSTSTVPVSQRIPSTVPQVRGMANSQERRNTRDTILQSIEEPPSYQRRSTSVAVPETANSRMPFVKETSLFVEEEVAPNVQERIKRDVIEEIRNDPEKFGLQRKNTEEEVELLRQSIKRDVISEILNNLEKFGLQRTNPVLQNAKPTQPPLGVITPEGTPAPPSLQQIHA